MTSKKIAILGGGISGLATAYFLEKNCPDVKTLLLEKQTRLGGWIHTFQEEGFLFEAGPRALPIHKAVLWLKLVDALHLQDQLLYASSESLKRFVYWKGRLEPVPDTFIKCLYSPLTRNSIFSLLHEWRKAPERNKEESLREFFSRRVDADFVDRLIDPLARGIYAGNVDDLSIDGCFPTLKVWEMEKGSLTKGFFTKPRQPKAKGYFSLKGGLHSLCQEIQTRLRGQILLNTEVVDCKPDAGHWVVVTDKEEFCVDAVVSALPAFSLSRVMKTTHSAVADCLNEIVYRSLFVVHIGYKDKITLPQGFGYLIPSKENDKILGVVFDSNIFPDQDGHSHQTRLTIMLSSLVSDCHEAEILAQEALKMSLDIDQSPAYVRAHYLENAIPQYGIGHRQKISSIQQLIDAEKGLFLTGNYLDGISLEDVLQSAKKTAESALKRVSTI